MKHRITILLLLLMATGSSPGGELLVEAHFANNVTVTNRRVVLKLQQPGSIVAEPWLLAGDFVVQYTDTNGITVFSNVLAGGYSLTIYDSPERSVAFGMPDTNGLVSAASLIGNTNVTPVFYTAAQIDALLDGIPDPTLLLTQGGLVSGSYRNSVGWTLTNATWVDATNGTDNANNGRFAAPCASIGYAASNSPPGAVIVVQPGLYMETIQRFWGQKDYVLSQGTIIVGATNLGGLSTYSAYNGFVMNSVQVTNNYPVRIFGRGCLVGGNDVFPAILLDNGDLEVEAELIANPNPTGYAIEVQGDLQEPSDATTSLTVKNSTIVGQVFINPFTINRRSFTTILLRNCSIVTTNTDPFLYDAGAGGTAESFKLMLEGVESRSPQTDFFASEDFGSRIFGSLLVLTNLPGGTSPGAYVQYFNKSVFTDKLTGNGSGLTSVNAATSTVVDGSDSTSFLAIVDSATGNLPVKTDTALTYDASTGTLGATAISANSAAVTTVFATNLALPNTAGSATLPSAGRVSFDTSNKQLGIHNGTKEVAIATIQHKTITFDPKTVCDGAVDRLFVMSTGISEPFGIHILAWKVSFEADPTTEVDLDLKRADAFIGVANSAVMDVLDTTAGVSSESTAANINSDRAVANGKVIYLEFGTAYMEANHQIIFEMWYELEED